MTDTLTLLLQKLDEPTAKYGELEQYYAGMQALAFLSPESKAALGTRFGRMATNIPRVAVTSLTERLRVTGFTGVDVWPDYGATNARLTADLRCENFLYWYRGQLPGCPTGPMSIGGIEV
ncbi:hypothetical protein MCEL_04760 [Mycolicibacterium celeriflavum]|uniref:Uncharacterized protein n=1 Tax=Mycolicibacterium celeriflavum TaxID=1249101 RepID=A0A7I7RD57_MYCCF|nr:hypothetical protein MCEL_04760 [Mycolicibacterium celeriflavum]